MLDEYSSAQNEVKHKQNKILTHQKSEAPYLMTASQYTLGYLFSLNHSIVRYVRLCANELQYLNELLSAVVYRDVE